MIIHLIFFGDISPQPTKQGDHRCLCTILCQPSHRYLKSVWTEVIPWLGLVSWSQGIIKVSMCLGCGLTERHWHAWNHAARLKHFTVLFIGFGDNITNTEYHQPYLFITFLRSEDMLSHEKHQATKTHFAYVSRQTDLCLCTSHYFTALPRVLCKADQALRLCTVPRSNMTCVSCNINTRTALICLPPNLSSLGKKGVQ